MSISPAAIGTVSVSQQACEDRCGEVREDAIAFSAGRDVISFFFVSNTQSIKQTVRVTWSQATASHYAINFCRIDEMREELLEVA